MKLYNVFYAFQHEIKPNAPLDGVSCWYGYASSVSRKHANEMVEKLLRLGHHTMIESV